MAHQYHWPGCIIHHDVNNHEPQADHHNPALNIENLSSRDSTVHRRLNGDVHTYIYNEGVKLDRSIKDFLAINSILITAQELDQIHLRDFGKSRQRE